MDSKNQFHTPATYFLMRMEHVTIVIVGLVLVVININELDWTRFIGAFAIIDVVGYLPGAIAFRRRGPSIAPFYHHLYNITHSYLTWAVVVGLWAMLLDGFEWAMLAIPIHLSGDRGIFGNVFKPVSLPFEPTHLVRGNDRPRSSSKRRSKGEHG